MNLCRSCDTEPASGRHSLPVDKNGDFLPVTHAVYVQPPVGASTPPVFFEEWGAVPCCKGCYDVHAAGGANGPAALDAHVKATESLRKDLYVLRSLVMRINTETGDYVNGQVDDDVD